MSDYRDLFPSRFAGGKNLPPAGMLVEIHQIGKEKMRAGPTKPEEEKPVMFVKHIAGPKPIGVSMTRGIFGLVMRKRLCEHIAGIVGSNETDDWKNARIVLYPIESKAAGETVLSIAARAPKPQSAGEQHEQPADDPAGADDQDEPQP
jgi:hypothetical protein